MTLTHSEEETIDLGWRNWYTRTAVNRDFGGSSPSPRARMVKFPMAIRAKVHQIRRIINLCYQCSFWKVFDGTNMANLYNLIVATMSAYPVSRITAHHKPGMSSDIFWAAFCLCLVQYAAIENKGTFRTSFVSLISWELNTAYATGSSYCFDALWHKLIIILCRTRLIAIFLFLSCAQSYIGGVLNWLATLLAEIRVSSVSIQFCLIYFPGQLSAGFTSFCSFLRRESVFLGWGFLLNGTVPNRGLMGYNIHDRGYSLSSLWMLPTSQGHHHVLIPHYITKPP